MAEAVDSIATYTNLIHAPGTTFNYGGVSMQIAGRIAEVVSGKSWQALFDEKTGYPCGMRVNYVLTSTQNPLIAGGARTTAREYLNFLEMIVNKGMYKNRRVLSENAIAEMLKEQTNGAAIENTPYPANPYSDYQNTGIRYGIGNWRDVVDKAGNADETSSPGAFGTHPWQDSKNNVAGVIFTRTTSRLSNITSLQIRQKIRDIIEQK
jgi:CubicO group peptidase (beta-lactamase class C family)